MEYLGVGRDRFGFSEQYCILIREAYRGCLEDFARNGVRDHPNVALRPPGHEMLDHAALPPEQLIRKVDEEKRPVLMKGILPASGRHVSIA